MQVRLSLARLYAADSTLIVRFRDDTLDESPALRDTLSLRFGAKGAKRATGEGHKPSKSAKRATNFQKDAPDQRIQNSGSTASTDDIAISFVELSGTHLTPLTPSQDAPLPELAAFLSGLGSSNSFANAGKTSGASSRGAAGWGVVPPALPEPLRTAQAYLTSPIGNAQVEFDTTVSTLVTFLDEACADAT